MLTTIRSWLDGKKVYLASLYGIATGVAALLGFSLVVGVPPIDSSAAVTLIVISITAIFNRLAVAKVEDKIDDAKIVAKADSAKIVAKVNAL